MLRCKGGDNLFDERLGGGGTGGDPDDTLDVRGEFGCSVHAVDLRGASGASDVLERNGVRRVRRADHDDGVGLLADRLQGCLTVRGGEAQVAAVGEPQVGEECPSLLHQMVPLVVTKGRLCQESDGGFVLSQSLEGEQVFFGFDQAHRVGCDCHRPDRLFVSGVPDVEDREPFARTDAHLVVDFGHEWADRVNDDPAASTSFFDDLWCSAVCREHQGGTVGHFSDVVDEDDATHRELLDDELVVNDLVVAVDGRLEHPDHPHQRLDRLFHSCTESPRFGEYDAFDVHGLKTSARTLRERPTQGAGGHLVTYGAMSAAKVTAVAENSPAELAGLLPGDELLVVNGRAPRDVIEFHQLVDDEEVDFEVRRGGDALPITVSIRKGAGESLGVAVSSPLFDRVRTCDNRCPFCFIHQLPKGMRRSLYVRDDDYRLSFLYGNFTTLTRFTELDAERVVAEALSPLYVSIHATDPLVRSRLLKNPRGATSLRWLRFLLENGIEVHGQIVVCPDVNDGPVLWDTLCTILESYPRLASIGVVPLGISKYNDDATMRAHSCDDALDVLAIVDAFQQRFRASLGHAMVFASDEYYLLANRPLPDASEYGEFPQHENGVGMIQAFRDSFYGRSRVTLGTQSGFFASVDGAPAQGYRAWRHETDGDIAEGARVVVVTGEYAAGVIEPLVAPFGASILVVENRFFGGTIKVAGLLTGEDIAASLRNADPSSTYLIADACLSEGRFLDGSRPEDLPVSVKVVASDGWSLRCSVDPSCRDLSAIR